MRAGRSPKLYQGVMVSSTFRDLVQHRRALRKAIGAVGFKAVAMENDSAKPGVDVIESSLQMVADASAYAAVISHSYGQVPKSAKRNPEQRSLTELEFDEAVRLGRPILLFLMGDEHDVKPGQVETDKRRRAKLAAFRERARRMGADEAVHRVYKVFNSLQEFEVAAIQSVADLRVFLDRRSSAETDAAHRPQRAVRAGSTAQDEVIPQAPTFYAEPPYDRDRTAPRHPPPVATVIRPLST